MAQARQLLEGCWDILADHVLGRAGDVFNEAISAAARSDDEALVRCARSVAVQGRELVQAMRGALRSEYESAVAAFVMGRSAPSRRASGLSLIAIDESELGNQVEQAATRLRGLVRDPLAQIVPRLQTLAGGRELAEADVPLRPGIFVQAAVDALQSVAPESSDIGPMLRLFPVALQGPVAAAYEAVARYLEGQGIAAAVTVRHAPVVRSAPATLRTEVPASISELAMPGEGGAPPPRVTPRPATVRIARKGPALAEPEPWTEPSEAGLRHYGRLQAELGINAERFVDGVIDAAHGQGGGIPEAPPAFYKALVAVQKADAAIVATKGGNALSGSRDLSRKLIGAVPHPVQKLAVQFVMRLFARFERDAQLPAPVRTLVVALRAPCVELTLADPSFLVRADHPARGLINGIGAAALGWRDDGTYSRHLLRQARRCVQLVLHSPGSAGKAFSEAHGQFAGFLANETPASAEALSRAKEALDLAEERELRGAGVANFLAGVLEGAYLEPRLDNFLRQVWPRLLVEAGEREALEPGLSRRLLDAIPELVWSVQASLGPADRKRLVDTIPLTVACLRDGWRLVSWPEELRKPLLEELMQAQAVALAATDSTAARPALPSVGAPYSVSMLRIRLDGLRLDGIPPAEAASRPALIDEAVRHVLVHQRSGVSHQWVKAEDQPAFGAVDAAEADRRLAAWTVGTWFNLRIGGAMRRVRLEGWSRGRLLALFSSRRGDHLYSVSAATLQTYVRAGWVVPAQALPALARAFETVIADVERSRGAAAPGA